MGPNPSSRDSGEIEKPARPGTHERLKKTGGMISLKPGFSLALKMQKQLQQMIETIPWGSSEVPSLKLT